MIANFCKAKTVTSPDLGEDELEDLFEIDESVREWNAAVIRHRWPNAVPTPMYSQPIPTPAYLQPLSASPRTRPNSEPPSNEESRVKMKDQRAKPHSGTSRVAVLVKHRKGEYG
jgi:hypothetical protein